MTPSASLSFPGLPEILEIAGETDPILRNLRITNAYFRLNQAMSAVVGEQDLSWCGFAVWASKTAGVYIRQQEVPAIIEDWINSAHMRAGPTAMLFAHALGIHTEKADEGASPDGFSLRAFAARIIAAVGGAIAQGNQVVFSNIAPPFATLLSLWTSSGGAVAPEAKLQFLNSLRNTQPPEDYLFDAFSAMFDAAAAPGSSACAQAMCYANALVGCVEQTAVQPYIVASMNVPVANLFLQELEEHLRCRFSKIIADGLKDALHPLAEALEIEFDRICTEWLMQLRLPDQALRLGLDVCPMPDGQMYPEALASIAAPQPLELATALNALQDTGTAAQDWTSYAQRMRFIAVLFRSRQQHRVLWDAPFTDAQIDQLSRGEIPSGAL